MKKPHHLLKNIGLRVKELRGLHTMTQEALSDEVGMHRTYVARIENGDAAQVSVVALDRIATALKSSIPELLEPAGDDVPRRIDPPKKFSRGRVTK